MAAAAGDNFRPIALAHNTLAYNIKRALYVYPLIKRGRLSVLWLGLFSIMKLVYSM